MAKRKTSKGQSFYLKSMPIVKSKKTLQLLKHDPSDFFKSHEKVVLALLSSLEEGNPRAFLEILNAYLSAKSKNGNPTIGTIATIVSQGIA